MSAVDVISGDPASCSVLGGRLRRQAETLRARRHALWRSAASLQSWAHPSTRAVTERLSTQLVAIDRLAAQLDELGASLQTYAADLRAAQSLGGLASEYASEHGLGIATDGAVRPAAGPVALQVAWHRREAMPVAQHHVDHAVGAGHAAADRLARRASDVLTELSTDAARLGGPSHGALTRHTATWG